MIKKDQRKNIRFGSEYVQRRSAFTADDMPEHLPAKARAFLAANANEEREWNARWFFEDQNDIRQARRAYFLSQVRICNYEVLTSLYKLLPTFCSLLPHAYRTYQEPRFFLQDLVEAFDEDYLQVSAGERDKLQETIEEKLKDPSKVVARHSSLHALLAKSHPDGKKVTQPLHLVPLNIWREFLGKQYDLPEKDGISEQFMAIYAPIYNWMRSWNLVEAWIADVAFASLYSWRHADPRGGDILDFFTEPRAPVASHNLNLVFPKLSRELTTFELDLKEFWRVGEVHSKEFRHAVHEKVDEHLDMFFEPIDQVLHQAGFEKQSNSQAYQSETFTLLAWYQINHDLTWKQVAEQYGRVRAEAAKTAVAKHKQEIRERRDLERIKKNCMNLARDVGLRSKGKLDVAP